MSQIEGEPIDIDRGNLNTGATIRIFNYIDDNWKSAVVQEIDFNEREILVDYEDGTQEWIGVDGRKICFPPAVQEPVIPPTPIVSKRKASLSKADSDNVQSPKKSRSSLVKTSDSSVEPAAKKVKTSSKKSASKPDPKSTRAILEKKAMAKPMSALSFMRVQLKNNKALKSSGKPDKKRKKSRSEQFRRPNLEITDTVADNSEPVSTEMMAKKGQSKVAPSRPKEGKKEMTKLKIKIGKNNECKIDIDDRPVSSQDAAKKKATTKRDFPTSETPVQLSEKMDGLSFPVAGEKKIKTLLPKRSIPEPLMKPVMSPVTPPTPETPLGLPISLSNIYPTANVMPFALTPSASGLTCPIPDCKKPFRNEIMLSMHIKHYHSKYKDMVSRMPNVADLAYARTVGEHIESPQVGFLERITRLEEDRLKEKTDDSPATPQNECFDRTAEDKSTPVSENCSVDRPPDFLLKPTTKSGSKKTATNKRLSGSAPSSPKCSVLLAQLQEPPLVPPSISIQSEPTDAELSVSQSKPVSVYSPQFSDQSNSMQGNSSPPIDSDEKHDSCKRSSPSKKRRLSQLESTDVINCLCGYGLEDGLMIQCDLCQCWQHGACMSFENESDVPSHYVCETCQFPRRQHSSRKYGYVQNWLKEGKLANFQFSRPRNEVALKREQYLKQSHEFLCNLNELKHAVRSLQVKIQILRQTPDHPKLYLWAKSWNNKVRLKEKDNQAVSGDGGPIPEDAINMADCRKHLSEHIEEEMKKAESMLRNIEGRIEKLDALDAEDSDEEEDISKNPEKYTSVAKQTLLMMMRDLTTVHMLKYC